MVEIREPESGFLCGWCGQAFDRKVQAADCHPDLNPERFTPYFSSLGSYWDAKSKCRASGDLLVCKVCSKGCVCLFDAESCCEN